MKTRPRGQTQTQQQTKPSTKPQKGHLLLFYISPSTQKNLRIMSFIFIFIFHRKPCPLNVLLFSFLPMHQATLSGAAVLSLFLSYEFPMPLTTITRFNIEMMHALNGMELKFFSIKNMGLNIHPPLNELIYDSYLCIRVYVHNSCNYHCNKQFKSCIPFGCRHNASPPSKFISLILRYRIKKNHVPIKYVPVT